MENLKELNEVFHYCIMLNAMLEKGLDITFQELKDFWNDQANKEEYEDSNYTSYKDFIIDMLDYNIRYQ